MKSFFNLYYWFAAVFLFCPVIQIKSQISLFFPFDSLIHTDPDVIFTEMFEQPSVTGMVAGYTFSGNSSHVAFDPSVPAASHGLQSCKLTTMEGIASNEGTQLTKKFIVGYGDSVFIRYYIKYNNAHTFHHSGLWLGGNNPAYACFPCVYPGQLVGGDSAFQVGTEIRNATMSPQTNGKLGFYNYWAGMHPFTTGPNAGEYFGNEFIHPNGNVDMTQWNCIEVRLKLNSPVSDSTGELTLFINGNEIAKYGKNFPSGTWNETVFNEGTGSPFEGFQWRNSSALKFTYFWLQNYATNNVSYPSANDIYFDHIVVAKKYIGPISTIVNTGIIKQNSQVLDAVFPNPANEYVLFTRTFNRVAIMGMDGRVVEEVFNAESVSTAKLPSGVYFLKTDHSTLKLVILH